MITLENNPRVQKAATKIWKLLEEVCDPEIPVLSITDLGIVREVFITEMEGAEIMKGTVIITPTFTGCTAMDIISLDIHLKLLEHGYKNVKVRTVLSPAWTTEWMSEQGRVKLKEYGIAPPGTKQVGCGTKLFSEPLAVQCPACNSYHTKLISEFGSTPCKALYQCTACKEPFDYFKCH